jgi:hypothetical protein
MAVVHTAVKDSYHSGISAGARRTVPRTSRKNLHTGNLSNL